MAARRKSRKDKGADEFRALDRVNAEERRSPWGDIPETPLTDRHAAGTPLGGTEVGGLAGTNIGDGDPDNANLEEIAATGPSANEQTEEQDDIPLAGPSGGAVGGTPAGKRSAGKQRRPGTAPGVDRRGDSTIGSKSRRK
jgi:hypothetical protein